PTRVGREKYLAGLWIIEAAGPGVALKLATEGPQACNRKAGVRRNAAKAAGPRLRPAQVSQRSLRRAGSLTTGYQKVPKEIPEAVSDRRRGVRGRGERRLRGAPQGEGSRDHETDDHHADLRRWSGAGKRPVKGGTHGRIRARRMGDRALRQRG